MKMIKICLVSALSMLAVSAFADPSTLTGNYQCQRVDTNNTNTSYPVSISKTGDTYTFQWANANGYPVLYGTGVMNKGVDDLVSVVYWDAKDQANYGNELFQVMPDGSLKASFTLQSDNKLGTETCTKAKS